MTSAITDFTQYTGLRLAAENKDPAVLREVAGQFEALFVQSLLKNMREASLGDPLFGNSEQHEMYQEMLDQQLAVEMATGKGIGLADMLVRQLGSDPVAGAERSVTDRSVTPGRPVARAAAVSKPGWADAKAFAQDIWPHAERAAKKLNVAPEGILAQVALETGWGAHVPQRGDGNSSFNLFGIKASGRWGGDSVTKSTLEFADGVPRLEMHKFRAYNDVAQTFDDYSNMLSGNPRYESVSDHGDDVDGFANALQASGYATDPAYADKIKSVLRSETMQSVLGSLKNLAVRPTLTTEGRPGAGSD